jgi:cyclophilin family peptidyl-prolyl cis-trans isomerase
MASEDEEEFGPLPPNESSDSAEDFGPLPLDTVSDEDEDFGPAPPADESTPAPPAKRAKATPSTNFKVPFFFTPMYEKSYPESSSITAMCACPEKTTLVTGTQAGTLTFWMFTQQSNGETPALEEMKSIKREKGPILQIVLLPDVQEIACLTKSSVSLFDISTWNLLTETDINFIIPKSIVALPNRLSAIIAENSKSVIKLYSFSNPENREDINVSLGSSIAFLGVSNVYHSLVTVDQLGGIDIIFFREPLAFKTKADTDMFLLKKLKVKPTGFACSPLFFAIQCDDFIIRIFSFSSAKVVAVAATSLQPFSFPESTGKFLVVSDPVENLRVFEAQSGESCGSIGKLDAKGEPSSSLICAGLPNLDQGNKNVLFVAADDRILVYSQNLPKPGKPRDFFLKADTNKLRSLGNQSRPFSSLIVHISKGDISVTLLDTPSLSKWLFKESNRFEKCTIEKIHKDFHIEFSYPSNLRSEDLKQIFRTEKKKHLKHDRPFTVSINDRGGLCFTLSSNCPWLDENNLVFGRVTNGHELLQEINLTEKDWRDKPTELVKILGFSFS